MGPRRDLTASAKQITFGVFFLDLRPAKFLRVAVSGRITEVSDGITTRPDIRPYDVTTGTDIGAYPTLRWWRDCNIKCRQINTEMSSDFP